MFILVEVNLCRWTYSDVYLGRSESVQVASLYWLYLHRIELPFIERGLGIPFTRCRGRDNMVDGFTTTCAIGANRHLSCEFQLRLWQSVLDTPLICDKVCQLLTENTCDMRCRWFCPVSSTNTTDRHYITEILLKVALNTIHQPTH